MRHILLAVLRYLITSDFKAVEDKFIEQGIEKTQIDEYFKDFKKLKDQHRITDNQQKDINYWGKQGWGEFTEFIDKLKEEKSKTEEKKLVKMEGAELFAENNNWYVYRILNHEACIKYGSNTKWCITQTEGGHWKRYSKDHNIYFYIAKSPFKDSIPENYHKIAALVEGSGKIEYWDALDSSFRLESFQQHETLPKDKLEAWENVVNIDGKKYKVNEIPPNSFINRDLDLGNSGLQKIPEGLKVKGYLNISSNPLEELPYITAYKIICQNNELKKINPNIKTFELDLRSCTIEELPAFENVVELELERCKIKKINIHPETKKLNISGATLEYLPAANLDFLIANKARIKKIDPNFRVSDRIEMTDAKIKKLPDNLNVHSLILKGSSITELPKNLTVNHLNIENTRIKTLNVEGLEVENVLIAGSDVEDLPPNISFEQLYKDRNTFKNTRLKKLPPMKDDVQPSINLTGSQIEELPDKLKVNGDLILIDMPNLKKLPKFLEVSGVLSIKDTPIKKLPAKLKAKVLIMDQDLEIPKTAKITHIERL